MFKRRHQLLQDKMKKAKRLRNKLVRYKQGRTWTWRARLINYFKINNLEKMQYCVYYLCVQGSLAPPPNQWLEDHMWFHGSNMSATCKESALSTIAAFQSLNYLPIEMLLFFSFWYLCLWKQPINFQSLCIIYTVHF